MTQPVPTMTFSSMSVPVRLAFPIRRKQADGGETVYETLTLNRPKTRHVKALAALVGADLCAAVFGGETSIDFKNNSKLAVAALDGLFKPEKLDGLTTVIADLCGVDSSVIDDLDATDLFAVVSGFQSFLPKPLSEELGSSAPTVPFTTDGQP